eukprot:1941702-Rhodomonas_salina.2
MSGTDGMHTVYYQDDLMPWEQIERASRVRPPLCPNLSLSVPICPFLSQSVPAPLSVSGPRAVCLRDPRY